MFQKLLVYRRYKQIIILFDFKSLSFICYCFFLQLRNQKKLRVTLEVMFTGFNKYVKISFLTMEFCMLCSNYLPQVFKCISFSEFIQIQQDEIHYFHPSKQPWCSSEINQCYRHTYTCKNYVHQHGNIDSALVCMATFPFFLS